MKNSQMKNRRQQKSFSLFQFQNKSNSRKALSLIPTKFNRNKSSKQREVFFSKENKKQRFSAFSDKNSETDLIIDKLKSKSNFSNKISLQKAQHTYFSKQKFLNKSKRETCTSESSLWKKIVEPEALRKNSPKVMPSLIVKTPTTLSIHYFQQKNKPTRNSEILSYQVNLCLQGTKFYQNERPIWRYSNKQAIDKSTNSKRLKI